jgi:tryptophan-rich sensory protein
MSFLLAPAFGVFMLGFNLSWNTLPFDVNGGMKVILKFGTMAFQVVFLLSTFLQSRKRSGVTLFLYLIFLAVGTEGVGISHLLGDIHDLPALE